MYIYIYTYLYAYSYKDAIVCAFVHMSIRASRSRRVSSQSSNGYTTVAQTPLGAPQLCDDIRALFTLTYPFDLWCVFLVSAGILFHLASCSTSSSIGNLVDGLPMVANIGEGMIGATLPR